MTAPDPELQRWVEEVTGSRVVAVLRVERGRETWFVDVDGPAGTMQLLLKGPRIAPRFARRSRLLSDFGSAREAAALAALRGTAVRAPAFLGFEPGSQSVLMTRMPGSALLQAVPSLADRAALMRDYAGQLTVLHGLEWHELVRPGDMPVPGDQVSLAVGGWLASVQADFVSAQPGLRYSEPLLELAVRWLHGSVPARSPSETRFLHGDAGANQFLFEGTSVTALLDWELSLLGDPMSDLGNARFREALYPTGAYPDLLAGYGLPMDREVLTYYTVLAATVLALGVATSVHRPRPRHPETVARLWQDAVARVVLCEAMAEAIGVPLDPVELDASSSQTGYLHGYLADWLELDGSDPDRRRFAVLARGLEQLATQGPAHDRRSVAEAGALLGSEPRDLDTALRGLAEMPVDVGSADSVAPLLQVHAAMSRRRLAGLAPLRLAETWDGAPADLGTGFDPAAPLLAPLD